MTHRFQLLLLFFISFMVVGCQEINPDPPVNDDDVVVIDDIAPQINLIGDEDIYLEKGDSYEDLGVLVSDNIDETVDYMISGDTVDTNEYGVYVIAYDAVDEAGNVAQTVYRNVYVTLDQPRIISSYLYETCDLIGFSVQIFDWDENLLSLDATLLIDDQVIDTIDLLDVDGSFEFTNLTVNTAYDYVVTGTYDLGYDMGQKSFNMPSLEVGTYRKLDDDYRVIVNDDDMYNVIYDMVYLPFESSFDNRIDQILAELKNVDIVLLEGIRDNMQERIIFVDGPITDIYEYSYLRGVTAYPGNRTYDEVSGVCCGPIAINVNYGGTGIAVHEVGHSVDYLLAGISYSNEFQLIHEEEKPLMFPDESYYDTSIEYFAEAFSYYYMSDITRQELQDKAPKTYAFMSELIHIYEGMYGIPSS